jgi:RNA polymerase sigma-54 factor
MRLEAAQHLRLSQEMKLSPRLIQAMEILQLPMMALHERIEAEMESNPVLELQEARDDEAPAEPVPEDYGDRGERALVVDESGSGTEDFRRLDEMTNEYGPAFANDDAPIPAGRHASSSESDRKLEALANTAAPEQSLTEYLQGQWMFVEASEALKRAGDLIIEFVEQDGRLGVGLEELADRADASRGGITLEDLRQALPLVQSLEPTGIAARNLRECLLLQLDAQADAGLDVSLERQLVADFLREIEMNRIPTIAKRTGLRVEQIKAGIERIAKLNPRPGLLIGQRDVPAVTPDVVVTLDETGQVVVTMAEANMPNLGVNSYYAQAARDRNTDKAAKQFLRKNIRSAQWLVSAIAQRRHTILRVSQEVFKVQRDFLERGPEALKPLPMAEVAQKVGVHVATVSRAVAEKYALTPQGIVPLRMFFSGGTKTAAGEDVSWDAIKVKLREIVDNEDKSNPLNDDQLAEALKASGIDIARRTVAKYRGLLDIPPARKRREY